jgi:putative Holliday junction resolvase
MKKRLSVLGLDVGRKRIGVAGCDGLGLMATGLTTVKRQSFPQDVEQFRTLVAERQADRLVVGLPYHMDGSLGAQAKQVQHYAERLSKALELPVEYIDERLTSLEAEAQMQAEKISLIKNKALIDRKAAELILQRWLDRRRDRASREQKTDD